MTRIDHLVNWFGSSKPEELIKQFLEKLTGPYSLLVVVFVVVCFFFAWLEALKKASRASREIQGYLRTALRYARSLPAGEKTYRTITTLARIAFQVAWVWTVYVIWNAVYNLAAFTAPGASLWHEDGSLRDQAFQTTQWNSTTSSFTLLSIGTLALLYWDAANPGRWAGGLAKLAIFVLALPGLFFGLICGLLVIRAAFGVPWHSMYLSALIVALFYTIFCFRMPETVRRLVRTWLVPAPITSWPPSVWGRNA